MEYKMDRVREIKTAHEDPPIATWNGFLVLLIGLTLLAIGVWELLQGMASGRTSSVTALVMTIVVFVLLFIERNATGDHYRDAVPLIHSLTHFSTREPTMILRARNPGVWTAIGAAVGTAVGTALGNSPVGLALGAALGLALAVFAARRGKLIR